MPFGRCRVHGNVAGTWGSGVGRRAYHARVSVAHLVPERTLLSSPPLRTYFRRFTAACRPYASYSSFARRAHRIACGSTKVRLRAQVCFLRFTPPSCVSSSSSIRLPPPVRFSVLCVLFSVLVLWVLFVVLYVVLFADVRVCV